MTHELKVNPKQAAVLIKLVYDFLSSGNKTKFPELKPLWKRLLEIHKEVRDKLWMETSLQDNGLVYHVDENGNTVYRTALPWERKKLYKDDIELFKKEEDNAD